MHLTPMPLPGTDLPPTAALPAPRAAAQAAQRPGGRADASTPHGGRHAAPSAATRMLVRRAKLTFALLLALTAILLLWQHVGMTKVIELTAPGVVMKAEDDRGGGGASVGTLRRDGRDLVFGCAMAAGGQWPFCKAIFELGAGGAGIDLADFDHIEARLGAAGSAPVRLGFVLVNDEEGLTRKDKWETYKINQIDSLDIPQGRPYVVPLRWFGVPQWWKDLARPPVQHSFVQFDRVVRVELVTSGLPAGDRTVRIRSLRLVGKHVGQATLLGGIVLAWIGFAVLWLALANRALRRQLRASTREVVLLAQVNKALELEARELAGQAHIDPLTGVLNRQGLRAELMSTSTLLAAPMSVIFVDVDHFKQINDTHGHAVGDAVLRQLAMILAAQVRSSDRLVRWGGEEFLIVCPLTTATQAGRLGQALRTALLGAAWPVGLAVTASFGVAEHRDGSEINDVIKAADEQLYRAKAQGRDQVCVAG